MGGPVAPGLGWAMSLSLPDYRVIEKIGVGANSQLFCVEHRTTKQLVTAKYVRIRVEMDESQEKKFIDQLKAEFEFGKAVDHPVLRKSVELRYLRRRLRLRAAVLFLEYVDGVPMGSPEFRRTLPEVLTLFKQVADGLHAMHQLGYVHADLKPGNMMVTADDEVKLIDFGQCSALSQAKERIQGTEDYMAPEQAAGSVLDQRTDVFGIGATLHRLLSGKAISTDMNKTVNINNPNRIRRMAGTASLVQPICEKIPVPVKHLIDACCKEEPVKRLPDMRAFNHRIDLTLSILEHHMGTDDNGSSSETPAEAKSSRTEDQ
jgi:serine/threonine-protein kinase